MIKFLGKKLYMKIYSLVPRLTVDLVVKDSNGVLLVKRDMEPCKGKWHFPGGTIVLGEKIEDAIKRVARNEAGIKVGIQKFLGVYEYSKKGAFGQCIALVHLVKPVNKSKRGNVRIFNKLPGNMISDQRKILEKFAWKKN